MSRKATEQPVSDPDIQELVFYSGRPLQFLLITVQMP